MKIAQIAPLFESVPPQLYGGTERVVSYLTEELIHKGHEVTLFASGDSVTSAYLVAGIDKALRLNEACQDPLAHHIIQMKEVLERAASFDILHFHTDYLHFPMTELLQAPCITTLHGRLDIPDLQAVYKKFPSENVVSISKSQKKPLPEAHWAGTVYHGLPENLHRPGSGTGGYWAFLGRISPEKGIDQAIEIATMAGIRLKIAAKIDKADAGYFQKHVRHLLDHPLIDFIGEINEQQKTRFLGDAIGMLFPIKWAEPFGMVMIEAMACGTPVLAFANGSVPEIIEEGRSGVLVRSVQEAVSAIPKTAGLSRAAVRNAFEERFTATRMTDDYIRIYREILRRSSGRPGGDRYNSPFTPLSSGAAVPGTDENSSL